MAQHAIVQSIKTITESLIRKAGFDKTRSGKVVGVNSLTNTYSVKVDGHTYNNVRVVNDATYNVGDTVKVNIPVNQMSQAYISASIFSDASIGKKIGHAESLINAIDGTLEDIKEIDGHIYQLDIVSVYGLRDPDNKEYSTHTGHIYKDGVDVTSATYWNRFRWYLMTSTGKEIQTSDVEDDTLTLPIAKYLYGMVLILEWVDENEGVILRKQTTLIDNSEIASVETTASNAYELADNTDNYFWNVESGTDTGAHITRVPKDTFIAATTDAERGYNLLAKPQGVALRYGYSELAHFTSTALDFQAYNNGVLYKVAEFGANGAQIGRDDKTHVNIYSNSLELTDSSPNPITFFKVRDAINEDGQVVNTFVGDGTTAGTASDAFYLSHEATTVNYTVTKNGTTVSTGVSKYRTYFYFDVAPDNGDVIVATYNVSDNNAKGYDFGVRKDNTITGAWSVIEGNGCAATGDMSHAEGEDTQAAGMDSHSEGFSTSAMKNFSHAEGEGTKALGEASHVEGWVSTASGDNSHAEGSHTLALGNSSHAEGYFTRAEGEYAHVEGRDTSTCLPGDDYISQGYCAHAEGLDAVAYGDYSHAQNNYTVASRASQTVIGEYNIIDTYTRPDEVVMDGSWQAHGKYAFIIGNGTDSSSSGRSNAFMVDWDGYIYPQATKMVDFIIEEGVDNGWTYQKWNSGKYEAWRFYQATNLVMTTLSSGTYYGTSAYKEIPFPSFHVSYQFSLHEEKASLSSGTWIYVTEATSTALRVRYRAHASTSDGSCGGNFYIRGTWK